MASSPVSAGGSAASVGDGLPSAEELRSLDDPEVRARLGGASELAAQFGSHVEAGLPDAAAVERMRARYGSNRLPRKQLKGFLSHLLDTFEDTTLRVLIGSAAFSIVIGWSESASSAELVQGFAILLAVVVVSSVTSVQNWRKDREFQSLNEMKRDRTVTVVRGGAREDISVHDLVVGDLVEVTAGDAVPCDGMLVRGVHVMIDESSMTGEAQTIEKSVEGDLLLRGGCEVKDGTGLMLATSVGVESHYGQIVLRAEQDEPPPTPLQEKLEDLADQIGRFGTLCAGITFLVLTAQWLYATPSSAWFTAQAFEIVQFLIVGITIIVVAVPEGLPLAVTISLAFSVSKMLQDHNLVRELKACETMGSATCIASDKTGTLTQNRMTVTAGWFFHHAIDDIAQLPHVLADPLAQQRLTRALAINSSARIDDIHGPRPIFRGSQTEASMLFMVAKHLRRDPFAVRAQAPVAFQLPFSSVRKTMTTVCLPGIVPSAHAAHSSEAQDAIVYVKGAPEIVLEACTHSAHADGSVHALDAAGRENVLDHVELMARQGLRTIAVAYRRYPMHRAPTHAEGWAELALRGDLTQELVIIAVVGIKDPVRPEVPAAVARCQQAGIRVLMVTGDNPLTASHIARECGILQDDARGFTPRTSPSSSSSSSSSSGASSPRENGAEASFPACMLGAEFRRLSPEDRQRAAETLQVLARSSPTDKHLLVEALIENEEIVAVTGDGTNDAPALRAAHVGLSMGIAGTEVAREASDIVILDDNFASIVRSVRWGRSIMENIRKFLTFQLTINMVALTLTFIVACQSSGSSEKIVEKLPLNSVQLLWLNLIMDSFAALALATEPPTDDLLQRRPEGKKRGLITPLMWKNMIGHAVFQLALLLWLNGNVGWESARAVLGLGADAHGTELHRTLVFNTFVLLQVFNLFNCRKVHGEFNVLEGFGNSHIGQLVLLVILVSQFLIVQVGGSITRTTPLDHLFWGRCLAIAFLSLPIGAIIKAIPVGVEHDELDEIIPDSGRSEAALAAGQILAADLARDLAAAERQTPVGELRTDIGPESPTGKEGVRARIRRVSAPGL